MLDAGTKARIDSARDILVGKVPDPKSQVEQITIALIYKFMDDMDRLSEELGGKATFFGGEFKKYRWPHLLDKRLGGHERLLLYAEGIEKMNVNKNIPQLFRDIFKGVFLPYRDPETLNLFLKEINGFSYDHSERLGDAYEYLLSVLGTQGNAGQFRTPRHIIDFIVAVVDPKKNETVLDPACGTAGFLISAFKHILRNNENLTPDERAQMMTNFRGYDIAPDMVRLSRANLYLHRFPNPVIHEYDTLTSEERWDERCDVIMANPPFMSPKGGIRPHNRFSIKAKRSEVLFVDYMAEHLRSNGRAGIIVPEGIIFQSQNAYTQLRKLLVEEYLVAVVSLPAGVFNPYSGVKTSILILDKALARKSDTIAFFKIENDGFGLGAQRREIDKNDLPQAHAEIGEYLRRLRAGDPVADFQPALGLIVPKAKIAANGEYNLSGERYREGVVSQTAYPLVPVGRFMKNGVKTVDPRDTPDELFELWSIPAFDAGKPELLRGGDIGSQKKLVAPGDVLLSRIIPHIRRGWVVSQNADGRRQVASTEWIVFSSNAVVPGFLRQVLVSDFFHASFMQTITGVGGSLSRANPAAVGDIQIPLPPLEVQREIVAEIEGYQKVIDGARAVLDNYRPHIPIHPDWPVVELDEITKPEYGFTERAAEQGDARFIRITDISEDRTLRAEDPKFITLTKEAQESLLANGDILVARTGATYGKTMIFEEDYPAVFASFLIRLRFPKDRVHPRYYWVFAQSDLYWNQANALMTGGGQPQFNGNALKQVKIPLPPLATQQAIVAEIEAEQRLVAANRELVARFEKKIQATLARVWGAL